MKAVEAFFEKLETYFDFRDATPENFNPIALENLARDLVQMCGSVRMAPDGVNNETHRTMIATISGGKSPSVEEWERGGFLLNEGARLVAHVLNERFGLPRTV